MKTSPEYAALLGSAPALSAAGRHSGIPDIRDVSLRWLAGTILTGVTSIALMGGALLVAVDNQTSITEPQRRTEQFSAPTAKANASTAKFAAKGNRPFVSKPEAKEHRVLRLSTLTRSSESNHVRTRPFARLSAPLGKRQGDHSFEIPTLDPVTIFSRASSFQDKGDDEVLYETQLNDEISIRNVAFDYNAIGTQTVRGYSDEEIESSLRHQLPFLRASLHDGTLIAQAGAIAYVDPSRFAPSLSNTAASNPFDKLVIVRSENVSSVSKTSLVAKLASSHKSKTVHVQGERSVFGLINEDLKLGQDFNQAIPVIEQALGQKILKPTHSIRVGYASGQQNSAPNVLSIYEDGKHLASIARDDNGQFTSAREPSSARHAPSQSAAPEFLSRQPSTYRSIYETALKHNLPLPLVRDLIKIYAFDVDFRRSTRPTDHIEVFYSLDPKTEKPAENSEILYTSLTLDGKKRRYYRFKTSDDGAVDYYDANGRSANKFLMRQPVPKAKFRSGFGWRRHPILRTHRLHKGVDWAAARGTPIFAAGDGVVEAAKWYSGYGRWIKIRHANGYKTAYAHMSRFAKGIRAGSRVRQGQIIGYVGSTGLSTGPHLHYEVIVNGRHVNPMRIRLPRGRILAGEQLAAFERERDRINQLLRDEGDASAQNLALNTSAN